MPSEFDLIARHFVRPTPQTVLGPGDDCALLAPSPGMELAITTDMLVSGTHFFPETDPTRLGWKTLAVSLSDLAAMGARPRWVVLAGSLPQADEEWLSRFSEGLFKCAHQYGVDLVGGDTTRGPLNLCVTALGELPPGTALRRDAAHAGDDLWISGQPGLAALGLAHLQGKIRLPAEAVEFCITRLEKPSPRVTLGLALREKNLARAAIDISDGLLADVGHLASRSHLDVELHLALFPEHLAGIAPEFIEIAREAQLAGGDDYELAFSVAPERRDDVVELSKQLGLPLYRIGGFIQGNGKLRVFDEKGAMLSINHKGFDHFSESFQ